MRFFSFVRKGIDLVEVEIELSLVPGLPAFQLTGLPDLSIKESLVRIKSALRHQEFILPTKDQVLIHLRPSFEKKTSQGLDLAIAAAYLIKTEQIKLAESFDKKIYFYGELTLDGKVSVPEDVELLEEVPEDGVLITGRSTFGLDFFCGQISCLQDLNEIKWCESSFDSELQVKNQYNESAEVEVENKIAVGTVHSKASEEHSYLEHLFFSETYARLLTVAAVGEHNIFVAGPAGTGKSTFSRALHSILRLPSRSEQKKINKISRITKRALCGRPYISPHHGSSDIALLGGGSPPQPGEVTRAQFGMLVLDEFLEFNHNVKESLREPIENHEITVCRAGGKVTFPADFLLVGTSNLCHCGDFVPNRPINCGYSSTRCKSYLQRLSGPLMDRFEIVAFSHLWKGRSGTSKFQLSDIRERVYSVQKFILETRQQKKMNSRLSLGESERFIDKFTRMNLMPELPESHRRLLALFRVARTIADLEVSETVKAIHIDEARSLTLKPFKDLKEAVR